MRLRGDLLLGRPAKRRLLHDELHPCVRHHPDGEKLGWELRADVTLPELGNYRWLTVGPPEQPDIAVLLNAIPGPPALDAATSDQIRSLMAKGWAGNVLLTTDDAQGSYEELTARGIEFTEPPEERPYGIDCALRDPSGHQFRLTQVREGLAV